MRLKVDLDIFDAIEFRDIETVRNYWTDHIDIDWQDCKGMNLLMYGVSYADISIVEFLLTKKTNLLLKNNKGLTVFDMAKAKNNEEIVKVLSNI